MMHQIHGAIDPFLCHTYRLSSLSRLPRLLKCLIIPVYLLLFAPRSVNTCQGAAGKPSTSALLFLILI